MTTYIFDTRNVIKFERMREILSVLCREILKDEDTLLVSSQPNLNTAEYIKESFGKDYTVVLKTDYTEGIYIDPQDLQAIFKRRQAL